VSVIAARAQVLEQSVAIVALRHQRRAAHGERARPIASGRPVDERPCGVEERMPGEGIEIVLRPDDIGVVQARDDRRQRGRRVPHVVVGNDNAIVRGSA